jgi:PQQ-dependent catabolism-associated CXXCW motif protein
MRGSIEARAKVAAMAAMVLAFALLQAAGSAAADAPEPTGLWTGPMYGPTPTTLGGATVVDLASLEALMADKPLLLDVGPADRMPEGFPSDRWLPIHRSIPRAVWMPGAGEAPLDAGREELFYRRIKELMQGDKTRPIVVFCRPDCWGSWNAGKRLVTRGYSGVHWFRDGIDAWREKHDTAEIRPDPGWSAEAAR